MTLAEKYGIQKGKEVEAISLNENPYKYEGTFKEFYGLVAAGKVKALKQYGTTVGISVGGYDTIEADNLAGKAFADAYNPMQVMHYLEVATQFVEANLIPNIISENPLRCKILNGRVTLDENLNEVEEATTNTGTETTTDSEEPTFTIDGIVYHIVDNPNRHDGYRHPMIARVDGEPVPNRKEIARQFLRGYGYDDEDFAYPVNTEDLERKVERILGE